MDNNFKPFSAQRTNTTSTLNIYTGLQSFKAVGVNLSKDKIEALIGREWKLPTDYIKSERMGRMIKPVEIWMENEEFGIKERLAFEISMDTDKSATGKQRFINNVGEFAWAVDIDTLKENPKMKWFYEDLDGNPRFIREAYVGEYSLFKFVQTLMRYNSRDRGANFLAEADSNGISIKELYDGNLDGLRSFIDWANENNNHIVLLCSVRRKDAEKIYYNQVIELNADLFFQTTNGKVNPASISKLINMTEKGERTTQKMYSTNFKRFVPIGQPDSNEEECFNAIPAQTVNKTVDAF